MSDSTNSQNELAHAAGQSSEPPASNDVIDLLVKNPTDKPGSQPFFIQIDPKSSVAQLKNQLESSYPGSPPVSSQRLIYAGKLLNNRDTLESIVSVGDHAAQYTVHLVVSNSNRSTHPTSASAPSLANNPSSSMNYRQYPNQGRPASGNNRPEQMPTNSNYPGFPQAAAHPPMPPFSQHPYPMDSRYFFPGMQQGIHQGTPAYPSPYLPQFGAYPPPPSDNPGATEQPPYIPVDPSAYAAHLQAMERIIADGLQAQQNNAQEAANAAAAAAQAQGADGNAQAAHAAQAAQAAASAAAAAAAMHAQAHVQAMANLDAGVRAQMENNQGQQQFVQQPIGLQGGAGFPLAGTGGNGMPNGANPQLNQPIGENGPRVRQFVFQFEINWSLISKLIFLVFLLGQESSPRRVYTLVILAVVIYLWQTNCLGFLRRIAVATVPDPARFFEMLFPGQNRPENAAGGVPGEQGERIQVQSRAPNRFGRAAVVLSFAYSFIYGFVCSLLPGWRPQPLPRVEDLLNPGDENQPGNQNNHEGSENQAAENDHEHAD